MSRSAPTCTCHEQMKSFDMSNYASNVSAVKLLYDSAPKSRNCTLFYGTLFMGLV